MTDARLRQLERLASAGDPDAAARAQRLGQRAGLHGLVWTRWASTCGLCQARVPGGGAVLPRPTCARCWLADGLPPVEITDTRLYPYQLEGAATLASHRAWLLADEPGLGKTAQALVALAALRYPPALVVCPPGVRQQWGREAQRWAPGYNVRVHEGGKGWRMHAGEITIVGWTAMRGRDQVKRHLLPRTCVVYDEAQAAKNPQALQTRGARDVSQRALADPAGRVWLLTATPAFAHAGEAWEVLRLGELCRVLHPERERWEMLADFVQEERMTSVMIRRLAQQELGLPPVRMARHVVPIGQPDAEAIEAEVRVTVGRSRLRRDCPEREPEDGWTRDQCLAAADCDVSALREALVDLAEREGELPLATVRRLLAMAKVPAMLELAAEAREAGQGVVMFSDHRGPVLQLASDPSWVVLVGGQTRAQRAAALEQIMPDHTWSYSVAATYGVAGTGLDGLQHHFSRALLVDLPWTPATLEQALGRLVRIGQQATSVLAQVVVADHWVDEAVVGMLIGKMLTLDRLGVGLSLASQLREIA